MVYVNRFTDPLPHYCGPEEGEEGGEGEWRKMEGGGQNWKKGKRGKFCARRSKKRGGGGETRGGRYKFTMRIILKGTRNILTRLTHLNYFFGFVLADFTLLTWN